MANLSIKKCMKKKYFIYTIIILSEFLVIYFLFSTFVNMASTTCPSCRVQENVRIEDFYRYFIYFSIIFTIGSFRFNLRTAKTIRQQYYPSLVLLSIIDIFLIPFCLILILNFYRYNGRLQILETEFYNCMILILLVSFKHVVIIGIHDFYFREKRS